MVKININFKEGEKNSMKDNFFSNLIDNEGDDYKEDKTTFLGLPDNYKQKKKSKKKGKKKKKFKKGMKKMKKINKIEKKIKKISKMFNNEYDMKTFPQEHNTSKYNKNSKNIYSIEDEVKKYVGDRVLNTIFNNPQILNRLLPSPQQNEEYIETRFRGGNNK